MDQCAILECDAAISEAAKLDVIARLAAHGIDAVILPPGMTLAAIRGGTDPLEDDDED